MSDEEFARVLGVDVSVWREAREIIPTRHGRATRNTVGTSTKKLGIEMPGQVHGALSAYAKNQDLEASVLVRSCVDWILKCPVVPDSSNYGPGEGWTLFGKTYRFNSKARKTERFRVQCLISLGAHDALAIRAASAKTSVHGLVRGSIIDLMEGKIRTLPIVAQAAYMSDDASMYKKLWKKNA